MDRVPNGLPTALTSAQLRWLVGLTNSRVEQLTTAGVITRVEKGKYSIDSIPRYAKFQRQAQEGPADWRAVRTALAQEKLAMARLDRAEREGRLIEKDEVKAMNCAIMRTVQARLLAVPNSTAPRLLELHRPVEAEGIVRDAIVDALTELVNLRVVARPKAKRAPAAAVENDNEQQAGG
jgi:hypothetical protein